MYRRVPSSDGPCAVWAHMPNNRLLSMARRIIKRYRGSNTCSGQGTLGRACNERPNARTYHRTHEDGHVGTVLTLSILALQQLRPEQLLHGLGHHSRGGKSAGGQELDLAGLVAPHRGNQRGAAHGAGGGVVQDAHEALLAEGVAASATVRAATVERTASSPASTARSDTGGTRAPGAVQRCLLARRARAQGASMPLLRVCGKSAQLREGRHRQTSWLAVATVSGAMARTASSSSVWAAALCRAANRA